MDLTIRCTGADHVRFSCFSKPFRPPRDLHVRQKMTKRITILLMLIGGLFAADEKPLKLGKYLINMPLTILHSFPNGGDKFLGNQAAVRSIENLSLRISTDSYEAFDSGISKRKLKYRIIGTDGIRTAIETLDMNSNDKSIMLLVKKGDNIGMINGEMVSLWFKWVEQ